jgi:hypothetical protein
MRYQSSVISEDNHELTRRAADSLATRPMLAALPIAVKSEGDSVTVSGNVPTCYEAMLVHRAIEQTPGVRGVVDNLEYPRPDESLPNPLLAKGRPQDVGPFLAYHVRRVVGGLAHIDAVLVTADLVDVRGSLRSGKDKNDVEKAIRTIPVLLGFRVKMTFDPDLSERTRDNQRRTNAATISKMLKESVARQFQRRGSKGDK